MRRSIYRSVSCTANMADEAKRLKLDPEIRNIAFLADEKVEQLLSKYPSTVFACDTSVDTRYIKCDFNKCSKHSTSDQGKTPWILNTLRNVKTLEKHVGKEVARFMKENLPSCNSFECARSLEIIQSQTLPPGTSKVLAVLNLADPQSQLGEWISLFLKAAEICLGPEFSGVEVITQSFTSRYELMSCITKLEFIRKYTCVEVLCVLSCHSSSQGQVFSCTPTVMSRLFGYEEFCSLHDFLQVLQDVLQESLTAVHISSCFTLKLDCSHQDWPVDIGWLKRKLSCTLSGSTKEVYETGSQVADLHVILATLLKPCSISMRIALKNTIESATQEGLPDLANEMGLETLSCEDVAVKASRLCTDEGVSAPSLVNSSLHVVILIGHDMSAGNTHSEENYGMVQQALAKALASNLEMRQSSDIKCKYTLLALYHGNVSLKEEVQSCIHHILDTEDKLFFVVLGSSLAHPSTDLLTIVHGIKLQSKKTGWFFGIHFQNITPMQAYCLKSKLKSLNSSTEDYSIEKVVATGLIREGKSCPVSSFPVLLYLVHLAIGENGERVSGQGITPAHLKYKQYRGPGRSSWSLEDVYMETSYVLSGLSIKAGLCLLSFPTQTVARVAQQVTTTYSGVQYDSGPSTESNAHTKERSAEGTTQYTQSLHRSAKEKSPSKEEVEPENSAESFTQVDCSVQHDHSETINQQLLTTVRSCGTSNVSDAMKTTETLQGLPTDYNNSSIVRRTHEPSTTNCDSPTTNTSLEPPFIDSNDMLEKEPTSSTTYNNGSWTTEPWFTPVAKDDNRSSVTEPPVDCSLSSTTLCTLKQSDYSNLSTTIHSLKPVDTAYILSTTKPTHASPTRLHCNGLSATKSTLIPAGMDCTCSTITPTVSRLSRINYNHIAPALQPDTDCNITSNTEATLEPSHLPSHLDATEISPSTLSSSHLTTTPPLQLSGADCNITSNTGAALPDLPSHPDTRETFPTTLDSNHILTTTPAMKLSDTDCNITSNTEVVPSDLPYQSTTEAVPSTLNSNHLLTTTPVLQLSDTDCNTTCDTETALTPTYLDYDNSSTTRTSPSSLSSNYSSTVIEQVPHNRPNNPSDDEEEYICVDDDEDIPKPLSDNQWDTSNDLPLMANVDEVLVSHYVLNLEVNFDEKVMSGDITLFLKPATELVVERQFQLCLDCSLVSVTSVEEINLKDDFTVRYYGTEQQNDSVSHPKDVFQVDKHQDSPVSLPYTLLPYAVHNWCMRIWKPRNLGRTWPCCIRIKYCTKPEGKSLTWATDQDQRPCVFSPGAYINNRSLMPCQEPPIAMSTWQASIHVPKGCTVLMSGDQLQVRGQDQSECMETFLYEMRVPLPCSTLALAIGWFEYRQSTAVVWSSHIPCRVYSTSSMIEKVSEELLKPCSNYITAACRLLGPYPFSRIDLVILPRCFACMGLMSPNVAFLSQSILAGDESMCVRVAHEISHSWFGLLIGSKDWSEEWLSEGFATFLEERIQGLAEEWQGDDEVFRVELRQILRHRTLLAELKHTDKSMQLLRPKLPNVVTAAEAVRRSIEGHQNTTSGNGGKVEGDRIVPHTTVTNGQVCSRKWTQIHYLKGYFLLHYMASMVGFKNFDNFLNEYVKDKGGQLVNSEEFFEYFDKHFPSLGKLKDKLIREWLESHGLPVYVPRKIGSPNNVLINQVESEFTFWKKTDAVNKRKKTQHIRSKKPIKEHPKLDDPFQLVVLLERLLERDALATTTLTQLDHCYHFASKNAEVRHRWCELIVKHRYQPGFPQVKRFLIEDQGMGIYLFGELLISQQPKQKQLVLDVLSIIGAEMDQCTLKTVQDMLEGKD